MSDRPIADAIKANTLTIKAEADPKAQDASISYVHAFSHGWSAEVQAEYGKKMGERAQWKVNAAGKIEWEP